VDEIEIKSKACCSRLDKLRESRATLKRAGTYTERSAIQIAAAKAADYLDEEQELSSCSGPGSRHTKVILSKQTTI